MFIDPEYKRMHDEIIRQNEYDLSYRIGRVLWGVLIAVIGFVAIFVICFASQAHASKMRSGKTPRYYQTPMGTTCADVRQKQQQYGFTSVAQARAFAAVNGILVTPTQERQILSCLRNNG